MNVRFRVSIKEFGGEELVREQFETRDEADSYFASLVDGDNTFLEMIPCRTMIITYEVFTEGSWVTTTKKTVVKSE